MAALISTIQGLGLIRTGGYGTPSLAATLIRINCGAGNFTGADGKVWAADYGFSTSSTFSVSGGTAIGNTVDDALYQSERWSADYTYSLPCDNGDYTLRLHLCELAFNTAGNRSMTAVAEGVTLFTNSDLFTQAGGQFIALIRTFLISVSDGALTLRLTSSNSSASLVALELVPR